MADGNSNWQWAASFGASLLLPAAVVLINPSFDVHARPMGSDFLHEWMGGWIVRHGDYTRFYEVAYAIELQTDPQYLGFVQVPGAYFPIVYPPFYYVFVTPFSFLSLPVAAYLFYAIMVACYLASAAVLARQWPETRSRLLIALPVATAFPPLLINLASNQKATVLLLLLTTCYGLYRSERPLAAGFVAGLIAFKPQLTLVIALAFFYSRRWRFVSGGILAGGFLSAVSLMLGPDVCGQFLAFVLGAGGEYVNTGGYQLERSQCWYGFFKLLVPGAPMATVQALTLGAFALLGILLFVLLRTGLEPRAARFDLQFAGLVIVTPLVSPHLYDYDMTIQLLTLALVGHWLQTAAPTSRQRPVAWAAALTVAASALATPVAEATGVQLAVLGWTALLAVLAWAATGETTA